MSAARGSKAMTLAELCQEVLTAQAQTLRRLSALLGDDTLLELLEQVEDGDESSTSEGEDLGVDWRECFEQPRAGSPLGNHEGNAYQSLEGVVREAELTAMLEFHLWAFPPYRTLIESPMGLHARVRPGASATGLMDALIRGADRWARRLPVSPGLAPRIEQAAQVPWLRFRSEVLKRLGQRPLGAV